MKNLVDLMKYCRDNSEIEIHSFLRFLGFYIAEGYTSYTHGTGSDITVSYNKYKENELVTKLINDIGFKCSIKNNGTYGYDCNPKYKCSLFVNTNKPDNTNRFSVLDYEVYTHN